MLKTFLFNLSNRQYHSQPRKIRNVSSNARYELNEIEIDRTRYLGITSKIKSYISLNAVWNEERDLAPSLFNFCVPLNRLLGWVVIPNVSKHDLILLRSINVWSQWRYSYVKGWMLNFLQTENIHDILYLSWRKIKIEYTAT